MSLGSLLARRTSTAVERRGNVLENPSTPLTSVSLLTMFGGTPTEAGVSVSENNALSIATFWRCAMTLSQVVAGFPLRSFTSVGRMPIDVPSLTTPATGTAFEQYETVMLHLLIWGNAYLQKIRNGLGEIVDLVPVYPGRVRVDVVKGNKVFVITDAPGHPEPWTTYEILHVPGPSTDGIRGLGVVAMARQSLGVAMAGDSMAAKHFGNGALLAGMLTTDRVLKQEEAMAIKERWRATMSGIEHAHDVAVLGAGTHFQPLAMSNVDAQFLQSRQWQALEICRWFGMPPHLAMLVDKSTSWGTGIEQQNMGLLKFTVRPWTYRIEQRFTAEVVPDGAYAEFDTDDLLKADTPTRFSAYQMALMSGWMTRNEVRAKENMPPLAGLDEPLIPTIAPPSTVPAPVTPDDPTVTADEADENEPTGS